jgi:hypothetical protein
LKERLAEASPPPALQAPAAAPMSYPNLPSPAAVAAGLTRPAAPTSGAAARLDELKAQRARLLKVITDDLSRRVEGLATQFHWKLVRAGEGTDLTPQAADLIRQQFSTQK